jgi:hypothetical protein
VAAVAHELGEERDRSILLDPLQTDESPKAPRAGLS